ncbi:Tripeptidyl-peptidase 2, partial [Mucuna pruriens]
MPCSSFTSTTSTGDNNNKKKDGSSLSEFKLNESTFLASLMPKKEIAADRFLDAHSEYDGRGALIAIFDSGVDPAADGLQVTSDGKPKVLDVIDCTGSGDIDTSKVVKAGADGRICGASGASLVINTSWKNPSGEWHVGYKLVYELFTENLISRLKKERKKKWDEKNQEEIARAVKQLSDFDQQHIKVEDVKLKRAREDLQNRLDILRRQSESYDDKGPVIDAVVWHDGEVWRVALDTQSLEDDPNYGKLANFMPLTNYRIERKYGVFSKLDACTFVVNVYNDGNVLSVVTDCSPHATHVAGIATAFHPKEPLLNGVAPGAQIISCKIGDGRLGSMETGTGLTRALIAAVEHKCDLINMSYGEATLLPDYGRFVDLVNQAVNKHRLIFVSSAGNSGPGLSTVGAPGGTSSSIIGVGAYVSPAMAAGAHCVVEPPSEGLESSRGPTADGDLGVCVSAPGGAVAPVPTWTLQRRMLMNGTSMASPSACGGTALLISAMKAEGIPVSPYSVRKALENTSVPIGDLPEDKLSTGQGLMQVDKLNDLLSFYFHGNFINDSFVTFIDLNHILLDRAFEYIQKCKNVPCVWYQIKIQQSGKTNPSSRGIYLREASACRQSTEWTVQVNPKFHEDAGNFEDLVPFEECIELHSTEETVVKAPDYLLLTHNGRSFNVVVDPSNLCDGLHYFEVYGIDCKAPWRGPLFRIPITITKPKAITNQPPQISFSKLLFQPGHIERRYIEVPHGATWAEATMKTSGFDTARRFYVDAVQICPLQRPLKWEAAVTFPSPASKSFAFRVVSGQTLELVISQFWSSGIGSHETTSVDFEVVFHGVKVNQEEVILDGSDAPVRIDAETLLVSEELAPVAILNKIRVPYRPIDSKISALSTDRDKLPSGKQILALTLTYKIKLEDGAQIKPHIPLLNDRIYDTKFESQFYMISDLNKRVYSSGDVYPSSSNLPKGEYILQLYLRHDNVQILEKMRHLVLFIERNLEEKDVIRLSFFSQPDGSLMGNGSFKSSSLVPGIKEGLYLGPPPKEKLPKNSLQGSVLLGAISYGKLSFADQGENKNPEKHPASYRISYVVPPNKIDEDKGKGSSLSSKKNVSERLKEEVRDAKIKVLASLKQETDDECAEWKELSALLKSEYPKYTTLLATILEGLISRSNVKDKIHHDEEVVDAANEVINSIDREELAKYFALKNDPEDEEAENIRKKMELTRDQLAEALYQKGLALEEIESSKLADLTWCILSKDGDKSPTLAAREGAKEDKDSKQSTDDPGHGDLFEENFKELKKWVDVKSTKYGILLVTRERRAQRLGTALKVLCDIIQDDAEPAKKKFYELKLSLLDEIGWTHLATYERQWMHGLPIGSMLDSNVRTLEPCPFPQYFVFEDNLCDIRPSYNSVALKIDLEKRTRKLVKER